jgi:O-antigen ligase
MFKREIFAYVSAFAVLVLGFSAFLKVSYANTALTLALLITLIDCKAAYRLLSRSVYFWLAALFLLYLLLRSAAQLYQQTDVAMMVGDQLVDYIKFCFIPALVIGYLFYRQPRLIAPALALIPVGLAVRVALLWDEHNGMKILQGLDRATFGDSAGGFGVIGIIAAFCGLFLVHRYLARREARSPWDAAGFWLGLAATVFGLACAFYSQTRAVWIAAGATVPLYILGIALFAYGRRALLIAVGVVLLVGLVAVVPALSDSEIFISRWNQARDGLAILLSGDWAAAEASSIGLRLRMLVEAWSAFLEKPFFGWGLGMDTVVLANSTDDAIADGRFSHFHNQGAWMLVELGVFGLLFYLTALFTPLWYAATHLIRRTSEQPLALFALFCIAAIFISCLSDMPLTGYRGPFMFALIGGSCIYLRFAGTTQARRVSEKSRVEHGDVLEGRDKLPESLR